MRRLRSRTGARPASVGVSYRWPHRRRKISRWATSAFVILLAVSFNLASPDPALANHIWPLNHDVPVEQNNGVKVSAPDTSSMYCIVDDWGIDPDVRACWKEPGDYWYVADIRADGRSVGAVWEDAYPGGDFLRRQGICRNPYGYGTWARCNKDYWELDTIYFTAAQLDAFHVLDFDVWAVCPDQWPCHALG
jgi:hypothetical protein